MTSPARHLVHSVVLAAGLAGAVTAGPAAISPQQRRADVIRSQVAEIRGLPFKKPIRAVNQSLKDFGKYLDKELDEQLPDDRARHYGAVVKKLGLYRGPEIKDIKKLYKQVMTSQAAAYYDTETETFYVLMGQMSDIMSDTVYAHELYHGLQDQHYDLEAYILSQTTGSLNDDEVLARQCVIEGEATYIMTLWSFHEMLGEAPGALALEMAVAAQSAMNMGMIQTMAEDFGPDVVGGDSIKDALEAAEKIPPFILDTMTGAYLKGMRFVHTVKKYGWDKVAELYARPPVSSEQILHPEKWFSDERPVKLRWPSFGDNELFAGWRALDTNTIGELQWHAIFSEHGLATTGVVAAAGWNGDAYAVLKSKRNGLLLLLYTAWDTEADARDFTAAYTDLLAVKYPKGREAVTVDRRENEVLIIEGGRQDQHPAWLEWMRGLARRRPLGR